MDHRRDCQFSFADFTARTPVTQTDWLSFESILCMSACIVDAENHVGLWDVCL